jgi:arylsulfatase A
MKSTQSSKACRSMDRLFRRVATIMGPVLVLGSLFLPGFNVTLRAAESKPNVVLIVIDNLGWADLGCYGSKFHKTPQIDQMAKEGMRFTQAYAAAPIGAPTRAAILTGRYPQRMNITASYAPVTDEWRYRLKPPEVSRQLPLSEVTLAEALKSVGYATGCLGKWHLGGPGFGPSEQGFDVNIAGNATGVKYREIAPYVDPLGNPIPGLEQAPTGEFLTDRLAEEAAKFIVDHKSKPFFLYLPHFAVHMPSDVKADILAKYGPMPNSPNGKQINTVYAALMESMDEAVGRVLKILDEQQLSQRTLVLLTSDNGGVCNDNGQIIPPTSNAPLRDGMGHLYEGGLRIPLIARWPGVVKAGAVSDEVVSCLDLFPTVAEVCAIPPSVEPARHLDGISLSPLLTGQGKITREAIYWHFPHYNANAGAKPGAAIRAGDWKLIEFYETGRQELFNVGKEPGEGNNLIAQNADVAKELSGKLNAWRDSVGAKRPAANPDYTPNPQSDDGTIALHSSTADVFGIMLRYEPLPNKDTLGYWVRQEDWAQFEFTVKRPGRFRLIAMVGCGTSGGSLVEFEIANQKLSLTVPATGHFQHFVPQDLGLVTLEKPGRYTLSIKPQLKQGVAVMDVRKVELKPVP